ncbi:MAG: hypothetical protein Q9207_006862 [Kuettlingeria erythrocarpa]
MQFKNIVAFVSLAIMASALPATNLVARTEGEDLQNKCDANQKVNCCNSVEKQLIGVQLVDVGIGCVVVDVLSPISGQCSGSQKLACCSTGSQTGLVNVGSVCPQIL